MPIFLLWLHRYHDFVCLGQNSLHEPILTHSYKYISCYPNAFSDTVNTLFYTQTYLNVALYNRRKQLENLGYNNQESGRAKLRI